MFWRTLPAILIFVLSAVAYLYTEGTSLRKHGLAGWIKEGELEEFVQVQPPASTEEDSQARSESDAVDPKLTARLLELFRFEVSPTELASRWHRQPSLHDGFECYRATLTAGDEVGIVGRLDYAFDDQARLQRIAFEGTSDRPGTVAQFATEELGFRRVRSREATTLYVGGPCRGELRIDPAAARHASKISWRLAR